MGNSTVNSQLSTVNGRWRQKILPIGAGFFVLISNGSGSLPSAGQ
ncbi:hypothetical protein [Acidaminococcus fermentans]